MQTAAWGPHTWVLFHTVAFNYPQRPEPEDRARYSRFYHGLADILPCKYCRTSYREFLAERPLEPYLRDREGVIYWTYMIHDRVNRKLSKKSCPFEEFVQTYENMRAKCAKRSPVAATGCIEPMRNFDSTDEVRAYAQRIWATYGDKTPEQVATMKCQEGGGGAAAAQERDLWTSLAAALGLVAGAVLLARP